MEQIQILFQPIFDFLQAYPQAGPWYTGIFRWAAPLLALGLLLDVLRSLAQVKTPVETWACLRLPEGIRLPITHWENTLGRAASADLVVDYPTVSRSHAALIRDDQGKWEAMDLGSKGGTQVNGQEIEGKTPLRYGDVLTVGGVDLEFQRAPASRRMAELSGRRQTKPVSPWASLVILTFFQLLTVLQFAVVQGDRKSVV